MKNEKKDNVIQLPAPSFLFPLTSFLVAVAILWGNVVANRGYGLACPDWPLCHGKLVPLMHMRVDVFIEYAHRLLAGTLTLFAVLSAVRVRRFYPPPYRKMMFLVLVLLAVQIVLGGITVLLKLPAAITIVHLANSLFIFILMTTLTCLSYQRRTAYTPSSLFLMPLVFVYIQSILGAVMRHTFSGMACTEFPTCLNGQWVPYGANMNVLIHLTHRTFGYITFIVIVTHALRYWKLDLKTQALTITGLVTLQIALGALSVLTTLSTVAVTLHLLNALLMITYFVFESLQTHDSKVSSFEFRVPGTELQ